MGRLRVATLLVATLVACDGTPFFENTPTEPDPAGPAEVLVVSAVRGRMEPTRWSITLEMKNDGGPGQFYLHLQAVSTTPAGPRTECGLTPERRVPAAWRETVAYVIECPRTPQWVTVYTRSDGEAEYRETDSWVY
jgi:hypothetical protein